MVCFACTATSGGLSLPKRYQGSTSKRYYLSSGPHSPLCLQDLSNDANLNSSHNASELPMKDTWDDKDPQPAGQRYAADHLVFSFEKLAVDPGGVGGSSGVGGGGVCLTEAPLKSNEDVVGGEGEAVTRQSSVAGGGAKGKGDANNNNSKGGGSTKGSGHSAAGKVFSGRALTVPTAKSQQALGGQKNTRKKGKPGGGKLQGKKSTGSKGERGDYSHHLEGNCIFGQNYHL